MLLNLSPESPTFDQHLHSLDSFDHYSSDMDVMSVGTDDQSVSDSPLEMSAQHQQQLQDQKQPKQHQDSGISPKKKRMRKTRAKVKSPELIQKLKTSRRQRANDRERNRMHGLNEALEVLRTTLPNSTDAKMTKIETLRYACNYISALAASVKLLEQNKNQDFGSELPNPDDYAFMLNFQYSEDNLEDMSQHSPCPLTHMSRGNCNVDGTFNPHQQLQQQLQDNNNIHHLQHRGQMGQGMGCVDTQTSNNVETFLFPEQTGSQHLNSFSQVLKQHHHHQQQQQQPQRYPAMSFSCFLNNQNKNRVSNPVYDSLLNSMGNNCDNFFEGSQPPMTPPTTYNTPPTSPDNRKQGSLQQHQHQTPQLSQPLTNSTSPNTFLVQHQHHDLHLQHKHIPQFNVQTSSQPFSSSPLPIIPGQFL